MASAVRAEFGKHPDLAARWSSQLQVTSGGLAFAEQVLEVLSRGEFSDVQLPLVYNAVSTAIFGWISAEYASEPLDAGEGWRKHLEQYVSGSISQLPTINSHRHILLNQPSRCGGNADRRLPCKLASSFDAMVAGLKSPTHDIGPDIAG